MKHIPFKDYSITDPEVLFGRQDLLSVLYEHAERLDQIQLIGARRFGKTCLLRCLVTMLKSDKEHNAYPIYLDLATDGIKGTSNVYRYLSSVIISNLYADGWINDTPISYSNIDIRPKRKWKEVYNQIDASLDSIILSDFFENIVEEYSDLLEQTFLLLFDEYEAMAEAFDRIDGFMLIREMSNREKRPISFWLAGATPWKYYTEKHKNETVGGSGEFNGITLTKYVRPLNYDSFQSMWEYECSFLDEQKKETILKKAKEVYEATGGVPFYAKSIGTKLCVDSEFPDYTNLQGQFSEMEKMLSEKEYRILREIQRTPKAYSDPLPLSIQNLLKYGLLKIDAKNRFYIPIKYYADYIKSLLYDQQTIKSDNNSINQLVDKIVRLIYTINEDWFRKKHVFMFDPSNDDGIQHGYLRTICTDRGKFSNFINAIYLLHWEGSKEKGKGAGGAKLPETYRDSYFRKAIDRLRHTFGNAHQTDKLETKERQIDKGSALEFFTGSLTEPITPSDWMQLQSSILKQYVDELTKIHTTISPRR